MNGARMIYVYRNGSLIDAILVYDDLAAKQNEPVRFSRLLTSLDTDELVFLRNALIAGGDSETLSFAGWVQDEIGSRRNGRNVPISEWKEYANDA